MKIQLRLLLSIVLACSLVVIQAYGDAPNSEIEKLEKLNFNEKNKYLAAAVNEEIPNADCKSPRGAKFRGLDKETGQAFWFVECSANKYFIVIFEADGTRTAEKCIKESDKAGGCHDAHRFPIPR